MQLIHKIQDKLFKAIFSRKEIVLELFQKSISEDITPLLDFSTLNLVAGSFVDTKLKENFADLVYHCTLKDGQPIQIVLLLEHKSYQEEYPHFQLLQYFLGLWQQNLKQKEKPVFIVPILFYHGKTTWQYQRMQAYFKDIPISFYKYLPSFDYDLVDISLMSDIQIEQFENDFLAISTFLFKYRHIHNYLKVKQDLFIKLMKRLESEPKNELLESIIIYLETTNDLPVSELLSIFEQISENTKALAMSTLERVIQDRDLQIIKNMLKEELSIDVISKVLKLSHKKINHLINSISNEN